MSGTELSQIPKQTFDASALISGTIDDARIPAAITRDTELAAKVMEAVFGDGSDGDVTIAADTTLTRDMFYNNLTVNATKNLNCAGYRVFIKNTLTNNGTIHRIGNAGGNGTAVARGMGGTGLAAATLGASAGGNDGGWTGAGNNAGGGGGGGGGVVFIAARIIVNNGVISANGGDGGNAYGGTGGVSAGGAGFNQTNSFGGNGGIGGAANGGGVGTASAPAATLGHMRAFPWLVLLKDESTKFNGGAGAGSGGASATAGIAGGGGGGGGGILVIIYGSATWGIETANGGAIGAGAGGASAATAGVAGTVIKIEAH